MYNCKFNPWPKTDRLYFCLNGHIFGINLNIWFWIPIKSDGSQDEKIWATSRPGKRCLRYVKDTNKKPFGVKKKLIGKEREGEKQKKLKKL